MRQEIVRIGMLALFFAAACSGKVVSDDNAAGAAGTAGTGGTGGAGGTGGIGGTGGSGGIGGIGGIGGAGGSGGVPGTGATGGTGTGGTCIDCANPPPADPGAPPGDGPGATFAMSHIYLGDTEPNGAPSQNAWKQYGFDIDGQISDKSSTYHCRVQEGGTKSNIQTDGIGGIDNSFGANIMPVFLGLMSDFSMQFNEAIQQGDQSYLIKIDGLGSGPSYAGLPASIFNAAPLGHMPSWDGGDAWPVFCEFMNACLNNDTPQISDGNDSMTAYPNSYVVNGVWVSNTSAMFHFGMMFDVASWSLPIDHARVTLNLNDPSSSAAGTVSGVMNTELTIESLRDVAGQISTSLCSGPTMDSVAQQIAAASDIMADGTQDPSQLCNGISIGFGFDARHAYVGTVLDVQPQAPDPCNEW